MGVYTQVDSPMPHHTISWKEAELRAGLALALTLLRDAGLMDLYEAEWRQESVHRPLPPLLLQSLPPRESR